MFRCDINREQREKKVCIFAKVSSCSDHVSKYICNTHARLFGLEYARADYTNGENQSWSRINAYYVGPAAIKIPLFLNQNNQIDTGAINDFALNAIATSGIPETSELGDAISCLVGFNAIQRDCKIQSWLDESGATLLVNRRSKGTVEYINTIPALHKYLFAHTKPSVVKNAETGGESITPSTLGLVVDESNRLHFEMMNPKTFCKMTDSPNCVATPITLLAIRTLPKQTTVNSFTKIPDASFDLCI